MSLSTVIAFTLLFKKITRKASIVKKKRNCNKTMSTTVPSINVTENTSTTATSPLKNTIVADHQVPMNKELSTSSCSSSEIEELEELDDSENNLCNDMNRQSIISAAAPSNKSSTTSPIKIISSDSTDATAVSKLAGESIGDLTISCEMEKTDLISTPPTTRLLQETETDCREESMAQKEGELLVKVRDFAYPIESPLHFGKKPTTPTYDSTSSLTTNFKSASNVSLSSPDFNGRDARALFDFVPETEYEVPLKAGQLIWVQYRQCPGWLIADVEDETGLVPEAYVEFI